MSLKRFGVSLEDNLLESLDQYVNENGFANRSPVSYTHLTLPTN